MNYDRDFLRIKADLAARPVRTRRGNVLAPPNILQIGAGNVILTLGSTDYKGLKYPSSDVTTVPSAAPASITTSCPDGISPAYKIGGGGVSLVWIGTRLKPGAAAAVTEMAGSFYYLTPVICHSIISMPISGAPGTFADVYVPFRI